jgi:selenocysteine lyase/cysteine desulfurase
LLASLELPFAPLADEYVQMRGFRVEHADPPELKRRLYEEHRIEVPVVETPAGWVMRVSVQAYNDETDLAALSSAVES